MSYDEQYPEGDLHVLCSAKISELESEVKKLKELISLKDSETERVVKSRSKYHRERDQARNVARKLSELVTNKPLEVYLDRYPWLEAME